MPISNLTDQQLDSLIASKQNRSIGQLSDRGLDSLIASKQQDIPTFDDSFTRGLTPDGIGTPAFPEGTTIEDFMPAIEPQLGDVSSLLAGIKQIRPEPTAITEKEEESQFGKIIDFALSGPDGGPGLFQDPIAFFQSGPSLPESVERVYSGVVSGYTGGVIEPGDTERISQSSSYKAGELVGLLGAYGHGGALIRGLSKPVLRYLRPWAMRAVQGTLTGLGVGGARELGRIAVGKEADLSSAAKEGIIFGGLDLAFSSIGGLRVLVRTGKYALAAKKYNKAAAKLGIPEIEATTLERAFKQMRETQPKLIELKPLKEIRPKSSELGVLSDKEAVKVAKQFERDIKKLPQFQAGRLRAAQLPKVAGPESEIDRVALGQLGWTAQLRAGQPLTIPKEKKIVLRGATPVISREKIIGGASVVGAGAAILSDKLKEGDDSSVVPVMAILGIAGYVGTKGKVKPPNQSLKAASKLVAEVFEVESKGAIRHGLETLGRKSRAAIQYAVSRSGNKFKSSPGKLFVRKYDEVSVRSARLMGEYGTKAKGTVGKLNHKDARVLGEAVLNNKQIPDNLKSAHEGMTSVLDDMADLYIKAGGKTVGTDGKLRPFRKLDNYGMPRQLEYNIAKVVHEDMAYVARVGQVLNKLNPEVELTVSELSTLNKTIDKTWKAAESGFDLKTKETINKILGVNKDIPPHQLFYYLNSRSEGSLISMMSSLERSRTLKDPLDIWETDVRRVLAKYILGAGKRIAEVEQWGPKNEKLIRLLGDMTRKAKGDVEMTEARKLLEISAGTEGLKYSAPVRAASRFIVGGEYFTKIATQLGATVANIGQPTISYMPRMPMHTLFKSGLRWLTDFRGAKKFSERSGALNQTAFRAMTGIENEGILSAVNQGIGFHFTAVNKGLQYAAADAGREYIGHLYAVANGRGLLTKAIPGLRRSWAQKSLREDFNIRWDKPLTEEATLEGMFRFARDTQLQHNVLKDPIWMNTTLGRPIGVLKRFGVKQFHLQKDMFIKEVIQRKNPMPLFRAAAYGFLGGEVVQWGRSWVSVGAEKGFKRFAEMFGKTDIPEPIRRERYEDFWSWERAVNNYASVATLGFVSNFLDLVGMGRGEKPFRKAVRGGQFFLTPVIIADMYKFGENLEQAAREFDDFGISWLAFRRSAKFAARATPFALGYRAGQQIQTRGQFESSLASRRGRTLNSIRKLIIEGKSKDAKRIRDEWNAGNLKYIVRTLRSGEKKVFKVLIDADDLSIENLIKQWERDRQKRLNP